MSTQNADWESFLQETTIDSESVPTFALTPDESVEDPESHVQKVKFTKTPAFLWMLGTGGFVGFVFLLYGISSYLTNAKQVVASTPSPEVNVFDETPQNKDLLPVAPDDSTLQPIAPPPNQKTTVAPIRRGVAPRRMVTPEHVVYQRPYSYRPYSAPRAYVAPQRVSASSVPVSRPPAVRPVALQPPAEPEVVGALYAPESGEGSAIETTAAVSMQNTQSSNPSIDQALTIYDGNGNTIQANKVAQASFVPSEEVLPKQEETTPIEINPQRPVLAMGEQPLTSAEYEKKFPEKAAQERLIARLAIPAETKIKGQTMGMLSWSSRESFPIGEEIRIQIKSDYRRDDKVIIPKGSVAVAQAEKGTMGQYIMANVTRIETPTGESFNIPAGMLTASTSDGFMQGKLKQPQQGGGVGRVFSRVGRSILAIGAASVVPQGDRFSDRVIQNVAAEGVDTVDQALDNSRDGYGNYGRVPSFYVIKPRTTISLVANGDIEFQGQ